MIFHCMYIPHFAYPFTSQFTLGLLHLLAIVNNAARNMGIQISLWDPFSNSLVYIPRNGISGSYALLFLVAQSCLTMWSHGLQPSRHLCPQGFSRQEYRSGLPCPPPGDLPNPGIKPRSPTLQADSLPSEPQVKPSLSYDNSIFNFLRQL